MGVLEDIKLTTQELISSSTQIKEAFISFTSVLSSPTSTPSDITQSSIPLISLHSTFVTQCLHFFTLVSNVEKVLREKNSEINSKEQELKAKNQQLQTTERSYAEREYKVINRELRVSKREKEIKLEGEGEKQDDELLPPVLNFNVRGTKLRIRKRKLHYFKGSQLKQLAVSKVDANEITNEISIDRDPISFACVLGYHLRQHFSLPKMTVISEYVDIVRELEFFGIPVTYPSWPPFAEVDSTVDYFKKLFPCNYFELLYEANGRQISTSTFHDLCYDKGPTLTIITTSDSSSGKRIFGGYSPLSLKLKYAPHPHIFIFSLLNPDNTPIAYFPKRGRKVLMNCDYDAEITFGLDIIISENFSGQYLGGDFPNDFNSPKEHSTHFFSTSASVVPDCIQFYAVK